MTKSTMILRELPSLRKVEMGMDYEGKLIIEFQWYCDVIVDGPGWRTLSFGAYRLIANARPGQLFATSRNTRGFRREYKIWLPWFRTS